MWGVLVPTLLTIEHQSQNTRHDVNWRVRPQGTLIPIERDANNGALTFAALHWPIVKSRGQVRIDTATHDRSILKAQERRFQFLLVGGEITSSLDGNHA